MMDSSVAQVKRRWVVYGILIGTSCLSMIGRIMFVESRDGTTPFLSANDRSRWCTIRALGDEGTYAIDHVVLDPKTGEFDRSWQTIDMVRHRDRDGQPRYYSSKPTLFPTMLAYQYRIIRWLTSANLADHPFFIGRWMLVINNVFPMALSLGLLAVVVDRMAETDWSRYMIMASAAAGTYLTTFAITLNNHLPAAVSVMVATYLILSIREWHLTAWWRFAGAGGAAAFAAANELPALSFLAVAACVSLVSSPLKTLSGFLPAALLVVLGFFATNFVAHASWRPPYSHRGDGPVVMQLQGDWIASLNRGQMPADLRRILDDSTDRLGVELSAETTVRPSRWPATEDRQRWVLHDPQDEDQFALVLPSGQTTFQLRQWDNWYEYPKSYWLADRRSGVDRGEPSRAKYALHLLIGHHGLISLTPIWLIAAIGLTVSSFESQSRWRGYAAVVLMLSVVVIAFYIARPLGDRNYGGVTSGLRWLFWLIPLWLIGMISILDRMSSRRWCRISFYVLLAASVASATYPLLNPWVHPWIYRWVQTF